MHGLSMGNDVLKQLHQEMSLEKVEKLMDQTREGVEYQNVRFPACPLNVAGKTLGIMADEVLRKSTKHCSHA